MAGRFLMSEVPLYLEGGLEAARELVGGAADRLQQRVFLVRPPCLSVGVRAHLSMGVRAHRRPPFRGR